MGDEPKQGSRVALHEALQDLYKALDAAEDLSDTDRDDLVTAIDEIRTALNADADESETERDDQTIGGRLLAAVERFEDRHPDLTRIMGRIADSLSEMGI